MKLAVDTCTLDLTRIVDAIAQGVARQLVEASPRVEAFCNARNNPLGSVRAFLNAARRGDFPSFRAGRRVLARRSDVEAWILTRERNVRPDRPDDDAELLRAAGVHVRHR